MDKTHTIIGDYLTNKYRSDTLYSNFEIEFISNTHNI